LLRQTLALCDRILNERPWDWYLKEEYERLCFMSAQTLGERERAYTQVWTKIIKDKGFAPK